jgi:hypothetical protein
MIAQLLAWPTLGVALLVFGFAPGPVLRLILLFYRRGNPRRQELLGELYAVPRIDRPFWVAEQLEVALFEGLRDRFRARRDGRTQPTPTQDDLAHTLVANLAKAEGVVLIHNSIDEFRDARLVADDVARGWRGRGWRGARPEVPPKGDTDPPAGV